MAGIFTPSASDSGDVRKERAFSVKQTSDGVYVTVARTKSFVYL
ncbi:MAG: hypothetical protein ACO2O5_14545 [Candidatus Caldipriscus sp.]